MKSVILAALALWLSSAAVEAQQVKLRPESVRGKTLILSGGQTIEYRADGSYLHQKDGRSSPGQWRIAPDGGVCVVFPNGRSRCDYYFEGDGVLYLGNAHGKLFRVRTAR